MSKVLKIDSPKQHEAEQCGHLHDGNIYGEAYIWHTEKDGHPRWHHIGRCIQTPIKPEDDKK